MDIATPVLHEENFAEKFFATKATFSKEVTEAIEVLKQENKKTGFINTLPANCGLPVWDKVILSKPIPFTTGNPISHDIILPLTITGKNLASIIVAHKHGDNYDITYYSTDELYQVTHKQNFTPAEIKKAENNLRLFFFLENRVFGTTTFYHIPAKLFADNTTLDADGNKTIEIRKSATTNGANSVYYPCTEWEVWYNPDGDACFCSGDEYDTGERLWTGDCDPYLPEPVSTQIIYVGGNGGCTWCIPPPGSGGGGGGGGGGTNCNGPFYIENPNPCNPTPPPPPPPQPDPCTLANQLAQNQEFKNDMQYLKSRVNDSLEYGIMYQMNNAGQMFVESVNLGVPKKLRITIPSPQYAQDGFLHSHYADTNALPVFSAGDIQAFCELYRTNRMKNPLTFTAGLVTASGTQYLLKIENLTDFNNFANSMAGATDEQFGASYRDMYKIKPTNTVALNEKKFLQYLQQNHSGLKLFRGNADFTQWTPLGIDQNNNVTTYPCGQL